MPVNKFRLNGSFSLLALTLLAAGCSSNPSNGDAAVPAAASAPAPRQEPVMSKAEPSKPAIVRVSEPVPLAPGAPDEYVVQVGDTLWDIASTFLKDPWFWPEIWYINPKIANPHLIYPGDVLGMVTIDGEPRITNIRASTYRMSPQARVTPLDEAVTSIPFEAISAFLSDGLVLERRQAERLPYLVGTRGDHMIAAAGNEVYVRGLNDDVAGTRYSIIEIGDKLVDPDNNRTIGYKAIQIGEGTMRRRGDPATVALTQTIREAKHGDRFISTEQDVPLNFYPKAPAREIDGRIISVVDGVTQIGQYQVVVINRGASDGLAVGDVLSVYQAGERVRDYVSGGSVRLPDEEAGTVMMFKIYDDIAFGLVMEATQALHTLDFVRNPI